MRCSSSRIRFLSCQLDGSSLVHAHRQAGRQTDRQTDRHTHIIPRDLTQSTTIHPYLVCMYVWRTTCLIPPHSHSRARARAREQESERESAHEEPMWIHSMCLCVNEVARIYDMHQIGCLYYAQMCCASCDEYIRMDMRLSLSPGPFLSRWLAGR